MFSARNELIGPYSEPTARSVLQDLLFMKTTLCAYFLHAYVIQFIMESNRFYIILYKIILQILQAKHNFFNQLLKSL